MTITFLELYAGFTILRIPMAAPTAFLVAVVDILPVLGTGTVLIPWGLLMLILGDTSLGVGILVLYLIITVVRQSLEPKIIGSQVGASPHHHPAVHFCRRPAHRGCGHLRLPGDGHHHQEDERRRHHPLFPVTVIS